MRECYEQLYASKFETLDEVDYFSRKKNGFEKKQKAWIHLKDIENGPDGFIGVFSQTSKRQIDNLYFKSHQRTQKEKRLPESFYETTII